MSLPEIRSKLDQRLAELMRDLITMHMNDIVGELLDVMGRHNLSMAQIVTLHILHRNGAMSVSQIANELHLSLAATSHLVDRLVRMGLVLRSENAQDRRHKQVTIAPAGATIVAHLGQIKTRALERDVQRMSPDLRYRLLHVLEELAVCMSTDK